MEDTEELYIGIDGGGTSTNGTIINKNGIVLGEESTSSSNWNSVGEEKARKTLEECITKTLNIANKKKSDTKAICLSLAGVDRPNEIIKVKSWMEEYFENKIKIYIFNDAIAALASGTKGILEGIVLISGTGTIAYGVKGSKKTRTSGFGPLFDIGSGYYIGSRILRAVAFASDGRGPKTSLLPALLDHLKFKDTSELIPWAYKSLEWSRIASVSFLCQQEALKGDIISKKIIEKVSKYLAESVYPVKERLEFDENFTIVLAGSILTHEGSLIGSKVKDILKEKFTKAHITFPIVHPSLAAAMLAKNQTELEEVEKIGEHIK
eukprot:TRINITY_DN11958_c0_g1_i1.p1 TRINITY_DN11958_c0_g1~~TRINITY_DN11958_c0_g1_i1.p1  ORF type:complete len:322 (+),score=75.17 TRINITY_DN11958_c0_g1_i1:16-981(+)